MRYLLLKNLILILTESARRFNLFTTHQIEQFEFKDILFKSLLGRGAFGEVYKGNVLSTDDEQDYAIKRIFPQHLTSQNVQNIAMELTLLARMRHPNVVQLAGVSFFGDNLCIVMEFVERGNLREFLDATTHNPPTWLELKLKMAMDVAKGVKYLHMRNPPIIHRDLKVSCSI